MFNLYMKLKLLLLTILFACIFFNGGCKKDKPFATAAKSIIGTKWNKGFDTLHAFLDFNPDFSYSVTVSGIPIESGTYSDLYSTITINASSGDCIGKPGNYNYAVEDTRITFIQVNDSCSDRFPLAGLWFQ